MHPWQRLLVAAAILALPFACGRPASEECFSLADSDGCASFTLDMTESTDYSLCLYVYADETACDSLPVQIDYLSPAGVLYREEIVLGNSDAVTASGSQAVLRRTLREGFRPVTYGIWQASVGAGRSSGVTGIGLRLRRGWTPE